MSRDAPVFRSVFNVVLLFAHDHVEMLSRLLTYS